MQSPRILITRLSHIGDCIATVPVVNAIREAYPEAFIGWMVETPSNQLLQNHPALDYLLPVKRGWLKSPVRLWNIRRELQSQRFDIAIDPQSLTKSSVPAWLSGAKRRIGLAAPKGRELAPWLNNELVTPTSPHIVKRSLELLQPLGVEDPAVRFQLWWDPQAEFVADVVLRELHLGAFAVINPGAGWESRRWPHKRFAAVARQLAENPGVPSLVVWAGEEERRWAQEIVELSGGAALLAPKTSLQELASILRRAQFYLGGDTGPMHLAAAVGADCVVLYGPTTPETSGAWGDRHIAIQAVRQQHARKTSGNEAMQAIEVDDVVAGCRELLSRQSREDSTLDLPRAA